MANTKKTSKKKAKQTVPPRKKAIQRKTPLVPKLEDFSSSIEIYLKYDKLESSTWLEVLKRFEKIKNKVINEYNLYSNLGQINYPKPIITPALNITLIKTGHSVIIQFEEGWKPKIKTSKDDIRIYLPKKVALPGLILYAIYFGYTAYIDTQIKRVDLELKKSELEEKLKDKDIKPDTLIAQKETVMFLEFIRRNQDIKYARINNIEIKR